MKKKIVSLMLIAIMVLSTLAGCGDQNKETTAAPTDKGTEAPGTEAPGTEAPTDAPTDAPKVEVTYPLEEKVKLTVGIPTASQVTAICASHGDTPFFKEWQKRTGVELEFVEMASKDMGLMFTSDPLPDIILVLYSSSVYRPSPRSVCYTVWRYCGLVPSSYHSMVSERLQPQSLCTVVDQLDTA